jgi:hypothetical protein
MTFYLSSRSMMHMVQDNTYVTIIIQTFVAGFITNIGCYKIGMQLPSLFENTKLELVCLLVLRNVSKILIRYDVYLIILILSYSCGVYIVGLVLETE